MRRRLAIVVVVAAAALPAAILQQNDVRAHQTAPVKPVPQTPAPRPAPPKPSEPVEAAKTSQSPQPTGLVFASNAGMVFSPIKPGQESAYEEVLGKIQEALAKSTDPVRKQQAASWKVYKSGEPFQDNTLYISVMDPAVKGADYSVFPILQEAYGDLAAREIFEKYRSAHAGGQNVTNVTPVFVMSTGKVAPVTGSGR
jgi:hypothetical protein